MLEVEFHINLPDGSSRAETDIPTEDLPARQLLGDFGPASGALVLRNGSGAETVFADTLGVLIPTFCLGGLADLVRNGRKRVDFFDHVETATLTMTDGTVTLAGSEIETRAVPAHEYVAALKACGARYLALAHRIWRDEPDRAETLAELDAGLAAANGL